MATFQCSDILGNSGKAWRGRLRNCLRCGNVFVMVVEASGRRLVACVSVCPFGMLVSFPASFCCHPIFDAKAVGANAQWLFDSLGSDILAITLAFALERMADAFPAARKDTGGWLETRLAVDAVDLAAADGAPNEYAGWDFMPF